MHMLNFVNDLRQVGGYSPGTLISSNNKIDCPNTNPFSLIIMSMTSYNLHWAMVTFPTVFI
jgi:hypothetical protein